MTVMQATEMLVKVHQKHGKLLNNPPHYDLADAVDMIQEDEYLYYDAFAISNINPGLDLHSWLTNELDFLDVPYETVDKGDM